MVALEAGAVEQLIVHDQLRLERFLVGSKNEPAISAKRECCVTSDGSSSTNVLYVNPDKPSDVKSVEDVHVVERQPLLDWFVDHHNDFGAELKFVSDSTSEGSQFVKGFGGIGAMLRYKLDFNDYEVDEDEYIDDTEVV